MEKGRMLTHSMMMRIKIGIYLQVTFPYFLSIMNIKLHKMEFLHTLSVIGKNSLAWWQRTTPPWETKNTSWNLKVNNKSPKAFVKYLPFTLLGKMYINVDYIYFLNIYDFIISSDIKKTITLSCPCNWSISQLHRQLGIYLSKTFLWNTKWWCITYRYVIS